MCDFCKEIKTHLGDFDYRKQPTGLYLYTSDEIILWNANDNDPYESDIALSDVKYCPYCGRKLV